MNDFQPTRPWTFFAVSVAVLTRPRRAFAAVAQRHDVAPPLAFLATLWLLIAAIRGLLTLAGVEGVAPLRALPLEAATSLAMGLGLHVSVWVASRKTAVLGRSLRIFCYGMGVWLPSAAAPLLPAIAAEIMILVLVLAVAAIVYAGLCAAYEFGAPLAAGSLLIWLVLFLLLATLLGAFTPPAPPTAG